MDEETTQNPNAASDIRSPLFEYVRYTEFKRLLNQLVSLQREKQFKTLAVLSEFPGEGKTFFVAVLALGYAMLLHKKVLIVNTTHQTRNRALYLDRIFGPTDSQAHSPTHSPDEPSHAGPQIIDLLTGDNVERESSESSDFWIGPQINKYRGRYDLILFDTCALSRANKNNIDPVIIAKYTDASILVTSYESVSRDVLGRLKGQFQQWQIQLLGTVFNSGAHK